MRKKIVYIIICLFLLMPLSSCSDREENTNKSTIENVKAKAVKEKDVYVTPKWLMSALSGNQQGYKNIIVGEVGYGDEKDCKTYQQGHIETAQYIDVREVEDATGSKEGKYNLLPFKKVVENMLKHGITKDTKVVLYGKDPVGAARVGFAYLWAGVKDVKILNGGIEVWKKEGYKLQKESNKGKESKKFGYEKPAHPEYVLSIKQVKQKLENDKNFRLVSIRSKNEWLGKTSGYNYMDKAGEPKGAVWGKGPKTAFDVAGYLNKDGTVKDLAGFKKVWKNCDFNLKNELSFYCGTGWRGCIPFLVLYENGYTNISVYDGGWYEWLMHDNYPVQVGDPNSKDCKYTIVKNLETGKAAK